MNTPFSLVLVILIHFFGPDSLALVTLVVFVCLFFQMLSFLLLLACASAAPDEREFSVVTWNVNGARKFNHLPSDVAFLREHDVILLQETFTRSDSELLELRGYQSHHARALPSPIGRNKWGLLSFFRVGCFSDGYWEQLFSPVDWLICSRWKSPTGASMTIVNVYIPMHTNGVKAEDVLMLHSTFEDLITTFPGDGFIVAGDFNVDRVKLLPPARPTSLQK